MSIPIYVYYACDMLLACIIKHSHVFTSSLTLIVGLGLVAYLTVALGYRAHCSLVMIYDIQG
jgi:hypothetical protein